MPTGFTIPAAGPATNREIVPDKSMARSTTPKVLLASFGDGYEQRLANGINSLTENYSLSFKTRTKEEIDAIVGYFDSLKGVTAFPFTIPDTNGTGDETTIKVVCDNYSISYDYDSFYSCSATFRRVYEA